MSLETRAAASSKLAFPAAILLLGASLTGCTGTPSYQSSIADAAQSEPFALPRGEDSGAPIPLWESLLVVCPYDDATKAPQPFATEAQKLRTSSTDTVQWLLFAKGNNVKTISVDRLTVDFCWESSPSVEYLHTQAWSAEKSDGAWLMTAAGPQTAG